MIKEYCEESNICVIRADAYGENYSMILQFVDEAMGDFPDLRTENISVKKIWILQ